MSANKIGRSRSTSITNRYNNLKLRIENHRNNNNNNNNNNNDNNNGNNATDITIDLKRATTTVIRRVSIQSIINTENIIEAGTQYIQYEPQNDDSSSMSSTSSNGLLHTEEEDIEKVIATVIDTLMEDDAGLDKELIPVYRKLFSSQPSSDSQQQQQQQPPPIVMSLSQEDISLSTIERENSNKSIDSVKSETSAYKTPAPSHSLSTRRGTFKSSSTPNSVASTPLTDLKEQELLSTSKTAKTTTTTTPTTPTTTTTSSPTVRKRKKTKTESSFQRPRSFKGGNHNNKKNNTNTASSSASGGLEVHSHNAFRPRSASSIPSRKEEEHHHKHNHNLATTITNTTTKAAKKTGLRNLKKYKSTTALNSNSMKDDFLRIHLITDSETFVVEAPTAASPEWLSQKCSSLSQVEVALVPTPRHVYGVELDLTNPIGMQLKTNDM
eukprot:Pgem_evm1s938